MLKESILKTLAYFSLFEFPLTKEEIFSYLWEGRGTEESIFLELENLKSEGRIEEQFGYFYFPGENSSIELRRKAVPLLERKLKKARRAAKLISWIPFLRAVFVCNSVASSSVNKESDIDFFIIAEQNRVWLVRLFSNIILLLSGMRRHGKKIADRICLSFYVDTENLDLKSLTAAPKDIYLAYWIKQLIPIYDPERLYKKIIDQNSWAQQYLAFENNIRPFPEFANCKFAQFLKGAGEAMWKDGYGDLMEGQARAIQLEKIRHSSVGKVRKILTAVVTEKGVIKFHEKDIRLDVYQKWLAKNQQLQHTYVTKDH